MSRNNSKKSNPGQWPDGCPRAPEGREYEPRAALGSHMSLRQDWRKMCGLRYSSIACLSLTGCPQVASCLDSWRWHPAGATETMNSTMSSCTLQVTVLDSATWSMIQVCLDDLFGSKIPPQGELPQPLFILSFRGTSYIIQVIPHIQNPFSDWIAFSGWVSLF